MAGGRGPDGRPLGAQGHTLATNLHLRLTYTAGPTYTGGPWATKLHGAPHRTLHLTSPQKEGRMGSVQQVKQNEHELL